MKNKLILMAIAAMMAMTMNAQKREMRGAWIQCVNGQFQNLGTKKMPWNKEDAGDTELSA